MGRLPVPARALADGDLIDGLRLGDQHRGGLRCRRVLGVADDIVAALRADTDRLCERNPPSVAGERAHVTNWAQPHGRVLTWSLLNRTGRTDDFSSDHDLSCRNKWFFHERTAPVLGEFLAELPHLINCRVNLLGPGASLSAHEEHVPFRTDAGTVGARVRFHLPLVTNDRAELTLDGAVFHLTTGNVYLVNQGCVHAARNAGETERVHLVWDALLTDRLVDFLRTGPRGSRSLFTPVQQSDDAVRRWEPLPSHRRLTPSVTAAEAESMGVCPPQ